MTESVVHEAGLRHLERHAANRAVFKPRRLYAPPYAVVYADVPWTFQTRSAKGKGKSPEMHYPCMTLEEIKGLPVGAIAAENSVLLFWGTWPMLAQSLEVISAWGFTYKACAFDWLKMTKHGKVHFGMGYMTRQNTEFCLLASKGDGLPRVSKAVRQPIIAPVGEHSAKPPETRSRIVSLFGDLPRIELFARQRAPGWDCLGYDVDGFDIRQSLPGLLTESRS